MEKKNKSNGKVNNEVLELEAEEIPLEETINNTLQKNNVTDMVIAGLKDKYGELRMKGVDDKEGYLECKAAKKEVRSWGILTEKITKAGRQQAIEIQRLWLAKEKQILAKIAEVEDPLQAEIDRYDANLERIEQEKIRRQEEAAIQRQQTITKMGALYENGSFVLNDVSFEITLIKEADNDIWDNSILPKYRIQYEKNESVRIEEERKRTEAAESLRLAQEEMVRKQKEMDEREAAFKKREDDRLAAIRRDNEEADRKIRLQLETRSKERSNQLQALGMLFNFQINSYIFQDLSINSNEIIIKTPDEWASLIENLTPIIEDRKADLEVKRQEEIKQREKEAADRAVAEEKEKQRQLAEKIERDRLFAESQRAEQLAQSSDKDKFASIVEKLEFIEFPEMKSAIYKKKVAIAKEKINEIINL